MFKMKLAWKLLIAHFLFSLLAWLVVHGVRIVQCDSNCEWFEYIGVMTFVIINLPGVSLSEIIISYSMDEPAYRSILRDLVMVLSSGLVFYVAFAAIGWVGNKIFGRVDA